MSDRLRPNSGAHSKFALLLAAMIPVPMPGVALTSASISTTVLYHRKVRRGYPRLTTVFPPHEDGQFMARGDYVNLTTIAARHSRRLAIVNWGLLSAQGPRMVSRP